MFDGWSYVLPVSFGYAWERDDRRQVQKSNASKEQADKKKAVEMTENPLCPIVQEQGKKSTVDTTDKGDSELLKLATKARPNQEQLERKRQRAAAAKAKRAIKEQEEKKAREKVI